MDSWRRFKTEFGGTSNSFKTFSWGRQIVGNCRNVLDLKRSYSPHSTHKTGIKVNSTSHKCRRIRGRTARLGKFVCEVVYLNLRRKDLRLKHISVIISFEETDVFSDDENLIVNSSGRKRDFCEEELRQFG